MVEAVNLLTVRGDAKCCCLPLPIHLMVDAEIFAFLCDATFRTLELIDIAAKVPGDIT